MLCHSGRSPVALGHDGREIRAGQRHLQSAALAKAVEAFGRRASRPRKPKAQLRGQHRRIQGFIGGGRGRLRARPRPKKETVGLGQRNAERARARDVFLHHANGAHFGSSHIAPNAEKVRRPIAEGLAPNIIEEQARAVRKTQN